MKEITPEIATSLLEGDTQIRGLLDMSEDQMSAWAALGHRAWAQGRRQEAKKIFAALIALDEKCYLGHAGMGAAALDADDIPAAIEHLRTAAALRPDDAVVCSNLGEALLRSGIVDEAAAQLRRAIELNPDARDPGANRARAIVAALGEQLKQLSAN